MRRGRAGQCPRTPATALGTATNATRVPAGIKPSMNLAELLQKAK